MKIRVKKRNLIAFSLILIFSLISIATVVYAQGLVVTKNFKVELAISNLIPNVSLMNITAFTVDPIDGSTAIEIVIFFNVTDPDGVGNINGSKAIVNLTLGGRDGQFRTNISDQGGEFGTCGNVTKGKYMIINCTILMKYYDNQSSNWFINASIEDINGGKAFNDTFTFQYNELSALSLPNVAINFSDVNLGQNDVKASPALIINNTGNDDFDMVNITAGTLVGTTDSGQTITPDNFGINLTNSAANLRDTFPSSGGPINLKDPNTGLNATLQHGHSSASTDYNDGVIADKGNLSLTIWVNVPSDITSQLYNATWNITVIDNP